MYIYGILLQRKIYYYRVHLAYTGNTLYACLLSIHMYVCSYLYVHIAKWYCCSLDIYNIKSSRQQKLIGRSS